MAAPWRDRAACRGEPTGLWYPSRGEIERVTEEFCARCPVVAECLEFGFGERHGIWGGRRHSTRREELENDPEQCEGCGDVLPPGRWRWCSQECARLVPYQVRASDTPEASPGASWQLRLPFQVPRALQAPIGSTLAYERCSRGVTRADAAAAVGVTEARWVAWEEGRLRPEEEHVVGLAVWLQTSPRRVRTVAELPGRTTRRGSRPGAG